MAPASFVDRSSRINAAVLRHLANAEASINGAPLVACIFEQSYAEVDIGQISMAGATPAVTLASSAVPSPCGGATLLLHHQGATSAWRIAEHRPDGAGMSVLILERAA